MIQFWYGENDFELTQSLATIRHAFEGTVEMPDSEQLDSGQLIELLSRRSLFDDPRLIILEGLSVNKEIWSELPELMSGCGDSATIIVVEAKPDKRNKTYKWLSKEADTREFAPLTIKDYAKLESWLQTEAKSRELVLGRSWVRRIIERVGVNQWELASTLDKLALADEVTDALIDGITEAQPEENVFALLETALRGDIKAVQTMTTALRQSNDPYMTFGLLTSQLLQLLALSLSTKSPADTAKDIGSAPFVLTKLARAMGDVSQRQVRDFALLAAETDMQMKSTSYDPWLLIEAMLLKIAHR